MTKTQLSTSVSETTAQQADELRRLFGYTLRDVMTIAIGRMYDLEVQRLGSEHDLAYPVLDLIDREGPGLWTQIGNIIIAAVHICDVDENGMRCQYVLSYHDGEMPAHKSESFDTLLDLIRAMHHVQPNASEWQQVRES